MNLPLFQLFACYAIIIEWTPSGLVDGGVLEGIISIDPDAMVESHNLLRASIQATNMQEMVWSNDLAGLAQQWASKCSFQHSTYESRRNVGGFSYAGENIYVWSAKVTSGSIDVNRITGSWWKEVQSYTYGREGAAGTCSTTCGHFTQMAWAETCAVGCGAANCKQIDGFNGAFGGSLVVCNYGPGGNVIGDFAWKQGPKCQDCGGTCTNGLCPANQKTCSPSSRQFVLSTPSTTSPSTTLQLSTVTDSLPATQPTFTQSTTSAPICQDAEPQCAFWADLGYCFSSSVFMGVQCPKSCKLCFDKAKLRLATSVLPANLVLLSSVATPTTTQSTPFSKKTSEPSVQAVVVTPRFVQSSFRRLQDTCSHDIDCGVNAFCTGTQFGFSLKRQCMCRISYIKSDDISCQKDKLFCMQQLDCKTPGHVCCRIYQCDGPSAFTQRCLTPNECDEQASISCRRRPRRLAQLPSE